MILNGLKTSFRRSINFTKKLMLLDSLTDQEISGYFNFSTRLKLFPRSSISLPFSLGRTIRGISFEESCVKDPFAAFILMCTEGETDNNLADNLCSLYDKESNMSAADIVDLPLNSKLGKFPPWSLVLPWEKLSLEEMYKQHPINFIKNRAKYCNFQSLDSDSMMYTSQNAHSQIKQTKNLWKSITTNGILPIRPLPSALIMVNGYNWRWFMSSSGNHRAYLSYIYGSTNLTVDINGIIDKKFVHSWPNVKNKTYTCDEALSIFESYYMGNKVMRGFV